MSETGSKEFVRAQYVFPASIVNKYQLIKSVENSWVGTGPTSFGLALRSLSVVLVIASFREKNFRFHVSIRDRMMVLQSCRVKYRTEKME